MPPHPDMTTPALAPEVRERPIIFSAPMVRAILAGRKTQTRRVLRWQPEPVADYASGPVRNAEGVWGQNIWEPGNVWQFYPLRLPAAVGDRLWVKETWAVGSIYDGMAPRDINPSGEPGWCGIRYAATDERAGIKDRSPLFMPRWASRLTLEVTEVRVERLQDISDEDVRAEGALRSATNLETGQDGYWAGKPGKASFVLTRREAFAGLWTSIHGKDAWDANPWVAVIGFRRLDTPPADTGEAGR